MGDRGGGVRAEPARKVPKRRLGEQLCFDEKKLTCAAHWKPPDSGRFPGPAAGQPRVLVRALPPLASSPQQAHPPSGCRSHSLPEGASDLTAWILAVGV